MDTIPYLDPINPLFPDPDKAAEQNGGLIAIGGNLSVETLINAYRSGIFPWFEEQQPFLWWSPEERCVILPENLHISRSLKKTINRDHWVVTSDNCFEQVVKHCAATRKNSAGTWITDEMVTAYSNLHASGHAHSLEVWQNNQLAGGLYGVLVGGIFCGESMFSLSANASKVALVMLVKVMGSCGVKLIDCQIENPHLMSMGASLMPRGEFLLRLKQLQDNNIQWPTEWKLVRL